MNYQTWKKENPTKNINDYFIEFPDEKFQPSINIPTQPVIHSPVMSIKSSTKVATDFILILASILIIVAFFLPWINIKLLNINFVNSSGSDLPDILKYIYKESPQMDRFVKAIYLIPIGAFLVLMGEAAKIFSLKAVGEVFVVLLSFGWFYTLYAMFNYAIDQYGLSISIANFYTIGMYLTLAGSLYYLFDIMKGFFD